MVFFTCNHCGESLKKPAVEKHYTWKSCRGATPFLTCVDCLKDFRADEYREHTKCVSELERYSAKGFVGKPDKNKGAQKQEIWCDVIQQLQTKPGLDESVRKALEHIGSSSNVPRKKPKFLNFMKSTMRMNPHNALKLWTVIEVGLADYQKIVDERIKAKRQVDETSVQENSNDAADVGKGKKRKTSQSAENDVASKKSKKKKKSSSMSDETAVDETEPEAAPPTQTNGVTVAENGKSKKSKKNKKVVVPEPTAATKDVAVENGHAKKSKKKQKSEVAGGSLVAGLLPTGFDWKEEIRKIVAKKTEIKVEKLKSKVLKQYAAECNVDEITNKMERTFAKHLKRLKTVAVDNGIVKTKDI